MKKDFFNWVDEEKIFILSKNNKLSSYGYTKGSNLQPIINFFRKTEKVEIEEVYIQKVENQPMEAVGHLYDIS